MLFTTAMRTGDPCTSTRIGLCTLDAARLASGCPGLDEIVDPEWAAMPNTLRISLRLDDPLQPADRVCLIGKALNLGDCRLACALAEETAPLARMPQLYLEWSSGLAVAGRYEQARARLRECSTDSPSTRNKVATLGLCLDILQDGKDAFDLTQRPILGRVAANLVFRLFQSDQAERGSRLAEALLRAPITHPALIDMAVAVEEHGRGPMLEPLLQTHAALAPVLQYRLERQRLRILFESGDYSAAARQAAHVYEIVQNSCAVLDQLREARAAYARGDTASGSLLLRQILPFHQAYSMPLADALLTDLLRNPDVPPFAAEDAAAAIYTCSRKSFLGYCETLASIYPEAYDGLVRGLADALSDLGLVRFHTSRLLKSGRNVTGAVAYWDGATGSDANLDEQLGSLLGSAGVKNSAAAIRLARRRPQARIPLSRRAPNLNRIHHYLDSEHCEAAWELLRPEVDVLEAAVRHGAALSFTQRAVLMAYAKYTGLAHDASAEERFARLAEQLTRQPAHTELAARASLIRDTAKQNRPMAKWIEESTFGFSRPPGMGGLI